MSFIDSNFSVNEFKIIFIHSQLEERERKRKEERERRIREEREEEERIKRQKEIERKRIEEEQKRLKEREVTKSQQLSNSILHFKNNTALQVAAALVAP